MVAITIIPDQIKVFGKDRRNNFYLIIDQKYLNMFHIANSKLYSHTQIIPSNQFKDIDNIILDINDTDIFILPYGITTRVFPKQSSINDHTCVITLTSTTTYLTQEQLNHFLLAIYNSDIDAQCAFGERYFKVLSNAPSNILLIRNSLNDSVAQYIVDENTKFSEQYGYVKLGKQQIAPNGEIAIGHLNHLQDIYSYNTCMQLNGEIILNGIPVIHKNGPEPYVNKENLANIYNCLADLQDCPIILEIENGIIKKHKTLIEKQVSKAIGMLDALFLTDSRYRVISEIGCAFNSAITLFPDNCSLNEPFGGSNGCVHFGIGNRNTLYHLDFLSPTTYIQTENKVTLIGLE